LDSAARCAALADQRRSGVHLAPKGPAAFNGSGALKEHLSTSITQHALREFRLPQKRSISVRFYGNGGPAHYSQGFSNPRDHEKNNATR